MILRIAAFVMFVVGAIVYLVDDTPDPRHLGALLFAGLAAWVLDTLVGERLP